MFKQCLIPAFCTGLMIIFTMGASAATVMTARASTGQVHNAIGPGDSTANPTFLELLQKGGPIMYPLYLCSILMIAFTIERAINLRRCKVSPLETAEAIRAGTGTGTMGTLALLERMQSQDNPLARIATACLCRSDRPILEIEKAGEDAAAKEVASLQRNNRVLSSIASVAPLLGLLGTVTGIIRTFMTVSKDEE
ncbi:MAG: MotA/TolQ/ExbB proton channel family protein, partial [bacterium]